MHEIRTSLDDEGNPTDKSFTLNIDLVLLAVAAAEQFECNQTSMGNVNWIVNLNNLIVNKIIQYNE